MYALCVLGECSASALVRALAAADAVAPCGRGRGAAAWVWAESACVCADTIPNSFYVSGCQRAPRCWRDSPSSCSYHAWPRCHHGSHEL